MSSCRDADSGLLRMILTRLLLHRALSRWYRSRVAALERELAGTRQRLQLTEEENRLQLTDLQAFERKMQELEIVNEQYRNALVELEDNCNSLKRDLLAVRHHFTLVTGSPAPPSFGGSASVRRTS